MTEQTTELPKVCVRCSCGEVVCIDHAAISSIICPKCGREIVVGFG